MTKEELEKDYYADRPIEPYSSDDCPNDWANIAHYAEENLERAFKRIVELEAQIEKMKCCVNCKHSRTEYEHCKTDKHEKWEIKENEKISG